MSKPEQEVIIVKPSLMSRIKEYALLSVVFNVVQIAFSAILGALL